MDEAGIREMLEMPGILWMLDMAGCQAVMAPGGNYSPAMSEPIIQSCKYTHSNKTFGEARIGFGMHTL